MPTSKGYTRQRADAATGLDYYGARYYDPVVGQFTSADDVLPGDGLDPWGLARYAYVEGNPIAKNDPSGHCWLVCAVIAAVAVGVGVTLINAAYQQVTTGHVDWNESVKTGVLAGAAVGLTIALGPVGTAIAEGGLGAVAGTVAAEGAADLAMTGAADVAGGAAATLGEKMLAGGAIGGVMGAGEGLAQGLVSHHSGGRLLLDVAGGAVSGTIGGAVGGAFGPQAGGMVGNMVANGTGQVINHVTTGADYDPVSFAVSGLTGLSAGGFTAGNVGTPVTNAFIASGIDFAIQYPWGLRNTSSPSSSSDNWPIYQRGNSTMR